MQLQKNLDKKIKTLRSRSGDARIVIDYLFQRPIIDAQKVAMITEKTPSTAYKLIESMESLGILKEITGLERGKIYSFADYLSLFEVDIAKKTNF